MAEVSLFETQVISKHRQAVVAFTQDEDDIVTVALCHSRIDMEEKMHVISQLIVEKTKLELFWRNAERCTLPNYHPEDPIVIHGRCGNRFVRALRHWNSISICGLRNFNKSLGFTGDGNLPYSFYYPAKSNDELSAHPDNMNALLVLHGDLQEEEAYLLNSYMQLSEVVSTTNKLSGFFKRRILDKADDGGILPPSSASELRIYKGVNARIIALVMENYFLDIIRCKKFNELSWSGRLS